MHSKIKLYFRGRGRRKILPVTGADGENNIYQIGNYLWTKARENPNQGRIYDTKGIAPCLNRMDGGGREPSIGIKVIGNTNPSGRGMNGNVFYEDGIAPTLSTNKGEGNKIGIKIIGEINSSQDGQVHDISGIAKCHSAGHNNSPKVAIPVLTPDRAEKRQNGRRFKENGDPMFALTAQDRHGVMVEPIGGLYAFNSKQFGSQIMDACIKTLKSEKHDSSVVLKINQQVSDVDGMEGIYVQLPDGIICYCIWYEKEQCYITIRKLTPKECFRLQGWTDDYFEKAAFVNSDSRLYMQAGNGVTVDVTYAIGKKIAECEKESLEEFSKHMNKPEKGEE